MIFRPVLLPIAASAAETPAERVAEQSRCARMALAECARICGAPENGWLEDANSAPQANGDWHWSIAHTREWAAAIVSRQPIGIDIEKIRPRREGLFDHVAGDEEWNRIGGRSWDSFFRMWTAKEAVLKANGAGVGWLLECVVVDSDVPALPEKERPEVRIASSDAFTPHPASPLGGREAAPALIAFDSSIHATSSSQRLTLQFRDRDWHVEHFLFSDHVAAVTCNEATAQWQIIGTSQAGLANRQAKG